MALRRHSLSSSAVLAPLLMLFSLARPVTTLVRWIGMCSGLHVRVEENEAGSSTVLRHHQEMR